MSNAATELDARNAPAMSAAMAKASAEFAAELAVMPLEEKRRRAEAYASAHVRWRKTGEQP